MASARPLDRSTPRRLDASQDCVSHNRSLRDYDEGRGFVHRGDTRRPGLPGQPKEDVPALWMSRYERPVAGSRT
ncbi:hypothetical protein [Streptomyces sp. CBMA123]|uniref:hypothetical protein n=1 Tax=Streptomyces sp. CBMA123 TaxID=1896313 RepID=UPI00166209BF|nr:hypothetical protein [Streptomyces sp. CBMA123]